jgi:hypothetical protein
MLGFIKPSPRLWLANCYFSSRRALLHSVAELARIELLVADFEGIRAA